MEPTSGPERHPILPADAAAAGMVRFIGAEIFRGSSYGDAHPLRVPRVSTVMDLGRSLGWLPAGQYLTSPRAKKRALSLWHDPVYLDALEAAERSGAVSEAVRRRHNLGTASNPVYPEVFRRPATGAGGSLMAAGLLMGGGIVHNPGGGTHHGMPDRANGFCYLNDPVLAVLEFRRRGLRRIAYVDIDAHHCDGVAHAFADDPDVLLISIHEAGRWPFTGALDERGAGAMWNLPLPKGAGDADMAAALDGLILPRLQAFHPEAIVFQCGADAVEEDPLSRLSMSNAAHRRVAAGLIGMAPRLLALGGGGYNPWSVARLWTGIWATLSGREIPPRMPPEAEAMLRALSFTHPRLGRAPPEHWFTTLADPPRATRRHPDVRAALAALSERARPWI